MKCIICHSENILLSTVNEEIYIDKDLVRVPVKILVCQNCGERYYDRKTMIYLEKVEDDLKNQKDQLREVGKILQLE